jgi:CBS domain-containing protein
MKVHEVMTREVETVLAEVSLSAAARKMRVRNIGFLPVVENNAVVGVITDRDIALRGLGEDRIAELTQVREIMTHAGVWCSEDDVLTDAAKIMEDNQVRRLLVLNDDKKLVGLLSLDDLAAYMSSDRLLGSVLRNVSQ